MILVRLCLKGVVINGYTIKIDKLEQLLGNNKHDVGKVMDILPFVTKERNQYVEILMKF